MSAHLLAPSRTTTADPNDLVGLWRAVDRVAGSAFCSDLDPAVVSFARARIAAHFGVAEDVIDTMIATQLLSLAARLTWELEHIARL